MNKSLKLIILALASVLTLGLIGCTGTYETRSAYEPRYYHRYFYEGDPYNEYAYEGYPTIRLHIHNHHRH